MNKDYITNRNKIIGSYVNTEAIEADPNLYGQYTIVSANLTNFLPQIDSREHIAFFAELLRHKRLSKLEQATEAALAYLTIEGDAAIFENIKGGAIIATFHTGSYRIVNLFLAKKNIPFTLVVGNSILKHEGHEYVSAFQRLGKNNGAELFRVLDAESAASGMRMLRELKEGRILLIYLDGNSGAGTETIANENNCLVDFLNQQLYARKGIGYLAHAAQVPIVPIISYRPSWDDIRLKIFDLIVPDKLIDRDRFSTTVTQYLYTQVGTIISKYPQQWEMWLSLHKVAKIKDESGSSEVVACGNVGKFNLRNFGLFQIGDKAFLLQKKMYRSYVIPDSLFKQLMKSTHHGVSPDEFEPEVWEELVSNGVLI